MKKLIATLIIINTLASCNCVIDNVYAATKMDTIGKIESSIFGFDYKNDATKNRIERLEKTIYGDIKTGDINKRIEKLNEDIAADVIGLEIAPSEDTYKEDNEIADNTVQYPIVDEIEQKIFNTTYNNRDFHTRIVTIERKLFGKIYDVEDYATRMERIKSEVFPERFAQQRYYKHNNLDNNSINSTDLAGSSYNRFTNSYNDFGYTGGAAPYTQQSNLNDELAQLEYETFGTEFSNEDTTTRIKRLNSVKKAQKSSSKYDSNKFNQRMSTVMEIGAMILMILAMVL